MANLLRPVAQFDILARGASHRLEFVGDVGKVCTLVHFLFLLPPTLLAGLLERLLVTGRL